MKTLIPLLLAALLVTGCKTPTNTDRVARAATVAEMAAFSGTSVYLTQHPENRAYFVASRTALRALIRSDAVTPQQFSEALKGLPIKELQGETGTLIVGNALVLYDALLRENVNLDANIWLVPIISAVERGISRALETPPPAQSSSIQTLEYRGIPAAMTTLEVRPEHLIGPFIMNAAQ